jgi:diguanylate cyclase (GGDEF)-like protein
MHLDLPTLVVMGSFVAFCAGLVLLLAWVQNRRVSALATWGFANLANAMGILCLVLGPALRQPVWSILSAIFLVSGPGLIWKGSRDLDAKQGPLVVALSGAIAVTLASAYPGTRNIVGLLSIAASSIYCFAATLTLWTGRKEHLFARWPLMILTGVHGAMLSIGTYSTFNGSIAGGEVPPLLSLFGLIHFESIVFTIGTAVFVLTLVKERSESAIRHSANIDPLTGIANRTAFMERADRVIDRCRRENAPVSVIMFDLDRFKAINDTHGHAVGDVVICRFCAVVVAMLRPNDVFGRMGGEEFAVVLPGSSIEAAFVRAERINVTFAEDCRFIEGRQVSATVSGGVSMSQTAQAALSVLMEDADAALYRAKAEGRNRIARSEKPDPNGGSSTVIRVA